MKSKYIAFLLILCLVLQGFCACDRKEPEKDTQTLALDTTHLIDQYASFTLFCIRTTKTIGGALGNGVTISNNASGETYIDMVIDITNLGSSALQTEQAVTATARNGSGTLFDTAVYGIETAGGADITAKTAIAPGATARLHCAVSVPESETALTLSLELQNTCFLYEYTLHQEVGNSIPLTVGTIAVREGFASLTFKGIEYTDNLLPSKTDGAYIHYKLDQEDRTYLVVKFDLTNLQDTAQTLNSFAGVRARYPGEATYTGFIVAEDADGRGFSSNIKIEPLATAKCFFLIEVPKAAAAHQAEVFLAFAQNIYHYSEK